MDKTRDRKIKTESQNEEQRGRNRSEYKEKLRRYRMRRRFLRIGIVLILAVCAAAGWIYDQNRAFHQYYILWEKEMDQNEGGEIISWGDGVLQYSKNGASYLEKNGTALWSVSYEMSQPTAVIREDYGLIFDRQRNSFLICARTTGMTGSGQTSYAISQGQVSDSGTFTLVCEKDDISYISYYKATGEKLDIEIKATLERVGYPLASAISPDGKMLMVSYLYVEGGGMQNKVVFYDFSNETKENVAGTFAQYAESDTIIPSVLFADNGHAVAVGDNMLTFYEIDLSGNGRKPSLTKTIALEHQIVSMFQDNGCIGLVWEEESSYAEGAEKEGGKILTMYDREGTILFQKQIDFSYQNILYNGTYLVLYNATECVIYTKSGKIKYENTFLNGISQMVSGSASREFYLVTGDEIQRIRLQ